MPKVRALGGDLMQVIDSTPRTALGGRMQHERFNPRNVNRRVVLTHNTLKLVKRNWTMISESPEAQVKNGECMDTFPVL